MGLSEPDMSRDAEIRRSFNAWVHVGVSERRALEQVAAAFVTTEKAIRESLERAFG